MGACMRAFDWSSTPLGPSSSWPQSLRTAAEIMLRSPVPIVVLWGKDGVMLYNDAYSQFAAGRHPEIFGSKVREGWPEVADFNDNVMRVVLGGGTLAYRDQPLTLFRSGVPERVWMNLDYSPIPDESGQPGGVIAIVVETTQRVLAEQRVSEERDQLHTLFQQAPGFMAMLRGPDHVFEFVNPAYLQLIGHRKVTGKPVREVIPEVKDQGFLELLDQVRKTGKAYKGTSMEVKLQRTPGGAMEDRFLDFVYQPIFKGGEVIGIFVEGADVTERVLAERQQRLLVNELDHRVKNTLATVQAIAERTFRRADIAPDVRQTFADRLQALATGHDLLTQERWSGADLLQVVTTTLAPFRSGREGRVNIQGEHVYLAPKIALTITMVLHELATNATKYGALSVEKGRLDIAWRTDGEQLHFCWEESAGPEVQPPAEKGFGSALIERAFSAELRSDVTMDFSPTGLVCEFFAPLAVLQDRN